MIINRKQLLRMVEKDSLNFKKISNHLYLNEVEQLLKMRIGLYNKIFINGLEWETQLNLFDLMKSLIYSELDREKLKKEVDKLIK